MKISPTVPGSGRFRLLIALPGLGIILLVIAVITLLWLLHSNEREEERMTLIKDVLWLEQNVRFHLNGNEEQLQQLANDLENEKPDTKAFRLRSQHILKNNPEIRQILWLSSTQQVVQAQPATRPLDDEQTQFGPAATQKAFEFTARLGKPVYSEPFRLADNAAHFEIAVPIFANQHFRGAVIAIYQMDALLDAMVPWWFTEKYQVTIVDDNDVEQASKSQVHGRPSSLYELPFEPPGYGLKFRVTTNQAPTNFLQRVLAAAILILAAGVFWSLRLIRDLMRKRLQTEAALREEHAFRKAMEDSLTVGMRARDLEGRIIYVNPAFCRMTGYSAEELVDRRPPMPYWVPEQLEETQALHDAVLAGQAPSAGFEITFRHKDGEPFQALIYEARLIDGEGRHTGWMASVLDITERKRAAELARQQQEQLQFTARLVTLGEMASTLAHELNQPLAAIASYNTGCLNLLERSDCDPQQLRPALEKIGVQAQRAGKIIRRVHDFVHKSEPRRQACEVSELIEDCLGFIEAEARKRQVRLHADLCGPVTLQADRLMLEQVLLNLIRNGMDAMQETPRNERSVTVSSRIEDKLLSIRVTDRGCGITPEVREKLFTAFFTTKNEGMGMGLSICRSIVEFHRGRLWPEANPDGRGTTFHLTLPLETQ